MTTKPQKIEGGWVQEFRKRFVRGHGVISCGANDPQEAESWVEAEPEEMEDFISDLLASERQRCVEIIGEDETPNLENLLVTHDSTDSDKCFENQTRNELRKELRQKLDHAKHDLEQLK